MSSIAVGGYGFGAAIWIPIETKYVNSNNVEAIGFGKNNDTYFTNPEVLAKVGSI